jgi:hypothetical protein
MTPALGRRRRHARSRIQLVVLVLLTVVLIVVLAVQQQSSGAHWEVAALAHTASRPGSEGPGSEPSSSIEVVDNAVLSAPAGADELERNPFEGFWNRGGDGHGEPEPPRIEVDLTLPGGERPVAIVDGRLRTVGDEIQGWRLVEVRPRAIVLESPAGTRLVAEMPRLLPVGGPQRR